MPVWLARLTEKASHEKLSQYWLDPGLTNGSASEIFTCSVEIADTAIKVAYIEQLELTLRSLRIPMEFVSLILENCGIPDLQRGESVLSGIHHELQRARQDVSKAEIYSAGAKQAFAAREAALNIEIDELRAKLEKLRKDSERNIRNLTDSLAQETQKWRDAENSLIQLRQMIKSNIDSCRSDIKLLDRYASRKISPRDFDSLRDHFFMSLKVIETLKLSAIN
jgi:hypothetical protein